MNRNKRYNNRKTVKAWFWKLKSNLKCSKCGEYHPAVIEFHHTNPHKKDSTIANMVKRGLPISRIKKEMKKCSVLCSNCHRKLHYDLHTTPQSAPKSAAYHHVKKFKRTNTADV